MPHYLFHLVSREAQVPDSDGIDLADAWAARREALLMANELVKPGAPAQRAKWKGWSLQVVDERGSEVLFVPLNAMIADIRAAGQSELLSAPGDGAHGVHGVHGVHERPDHQRDRTCVDAYRTTLRLAAEAIRQVERCRQLQRAVVTEIKSARETARLSAELMERGRTLPAGSLPR